MYQKIKTAIILCGGQGTRLRPLTYEIPKALIPIHGKPLVEHQLDLFKKYEIENVVLALGHMKEKIKGYFNSHRNSEMKINYIEEDAPLGTGGPIKLASETGILGKRFIITNGDELKDININDMLEFHLNNKALVTLALTEVNDPSQYGIAELENNKIVRFIEKPSNGSEPSRYASAGFYIFEKEVLDMIPDGFSMLEKAIFPEIAKKGKLFGFIFSGQWFDTGNMERYERAIKLWKDF